MGKIDDDFDEGYLFFVPKNFLFSFHNLFIDLPGNHISIVTRRRKTGFPQIHNRPNSLRLTETGIDHKQKSHAHTGTETDGTIR
jgi:hypothetical protein